MSLSLVSASSGGFQPLTADDLKRLQVAQFNHDETYHREIARLPVQRRLTHMTLHFAKYCGRMLGDQEDEEQTIADVFAITLSSANILSLTLTPLAHPEKQPTRAEFVRALGIAMGRMSAACEKLDHLEDFPFRQTLKESVSNIAEATLAYSAAQGWNLKSLVTTRLNDVRSGAFLPGLTS